MAMYFTFPLCYGLGRDVLLNSGPIVSVGFCLSVKDRGIHLKIYMIGLLQTGHSCAPEFNKMNVYIVSSYSSRTLTLIQFRANKPSSNTPLFPCTEGLVLNWLYPRPLSPSAP